MKYGALFLLLGACSLWGGLLSESWVWRGVVGYAGISLVLLGGIYTSGSPGVWLKRSDGTLKPASYILLGPIHLLNWLSFQLAVRVSQEQPYHEIWPDLILGRRLLPHEAQLLHDSRHPAVLDLTCEFSESRCLVGPHYLCLPVLDHTPPSENQLQTGLEFIAQQIRVRPVYVHCALGHGRSATLAAAWLMRAEGLAVPAAEQKLRAMRTGVRLKQSQRDLLAATFAKGSRQK